MQPPAHRRFADERVVIMSAPNGARRTTQDHSALPVTPAQLADCASSLARNGVSVLHLHVRDEQQLHTLDVKRYRAATSAIKAATGAAMIVQVTTEAVGRYKPPQQMAVVRELRPEAVSLALRELCPDESAEGVAGRFFEWLVRERIWPQYILYSAEDVKRFSSLQRKGLFAEAHPYCMLVLGEYGNAREGTVDELDAMLAELDTQQFPWSVCCFGANEHAAAVNAAARGGHVRLGFENNLRLKDGSRATDNAELVAQFNRAREHRQRRPATADEIRAHWLAA